MKTPTILGIELTTTANVSEVDAVSSPRKNTMDSETEMTTAANLSEIDVAHIATRQQSKKTYYGQ